MSRACNDRERLAPPPSRGGRTRASLLALAALLLAAPAGAETLEVRPDLTFQGTKPFRVEVAAHLGDTIRIDLPAQSGTGYAWTATIAGDAVEPRRSEKRPATRPGGPTREIQNYFASALGTARITFVYHRPWETSKEPARQAIVSIAVTEPPPPPEAPGQTP